MGNKRNTNLIEKEFVQFNINDNKIIGTINYTITLYAVSDDFVETEDVNEIKDALENNSNVIERVSKTVYSGFKVWSDAIIDRCIG